MRRFTLAALSRLPSTTAFQALWIHGSATRIVIDSGGDETHLYYGRRRHAYWQAGRQRVQGTWTLDGTKL